MIQTRSAFSLLEELKSSSPTTNINGHSMFSTCKHGNANVHVTEVMKQDACVCVCLIFHLHHIVRGQVSRQGHVFKAHVAFIIIGPVLWLTGG